MYSRFRRNKEGLAGEPGIAPKLNDRYKDPKLTQALNFVKKYIAVAVDNPAAGEASDLERYTLALIMITMLYLAIF